MNRKVIPQIRKLIFKLLVQNGGSYKGTMRLAENIPATTQGVIRSLHRCQQEQLIKSIHPHAGRGHQTIYILTKKGKQAACSK